MNNTKINNKDANTITFVVPCENGTVELSYNSEETQKISLHTSEAKELIQHCVPIAVSNDYDLLVLDY